MKNRKVLVPLVAIASVGWLMFSCGNSSKTQVANLEVKDSIVEAKQEPVANVENDKGLIMGFYQFVLGEKEMTDEVLDQYLSVELKKSLWTEDYDGCYEFWRFRTIAQDYNQEVGEISKIKDIQPLNDGWYAVSYLDMGFDGKTEVKVSDGKITDFKQDKSWEATE